MTGLEIIQLTKDLILILAAIVGSSVAVRGLSTWSDQLRGTNEHDLARNILVKVYRYRDALHGVRFPAMYGHEMPEPSEDTNKKNMTWHEKRFYGTSEAYKARWDKVDIEKKSLYGDLLEAEAYWGDELNNKFKELDKLDQGLFNVVRQFLVTQDPHSYPEEKKVAQEYLRENKGILYDRLGKEPDDFRNRISEATAKIEGFLKPRLKNNHKSDRN